MKCLLMILIAGGVIGSSLAGCSPGLSSTSIANLQPAAAMENTATSETVNYPATRGTPATQLAATPTHQFQVDTKAAPRLDNQEQTVKNVIPIPTPADPNLQKLVEQARADLAGRLKIPADQIVLVEFKSVEWPDGSLGCPQPGMAYTQVQVDGLLIRFQANSVLFDYHSGGVRPPFLCEHTDGSTP